jgi:hypothetical protein
MEYTFALTPGVVREKSTSNSTNPPSRLNEALVATPPPAEIVQPRLVIAGAPYAATKSLSFGQNVPVELAALLLLLLLLLPEEDEPDELLHLKKQGQLIIGATRDQ